jgi:hypothetical protein
MIRRSLGFGLAVGCTSIGLFAALVNAKPNLDLPKSEIVINQDIDNNGKPDLIIASYFIRPIFVPKYDSSNSCHPIPGKFVRYTLYKDSVKTGEVILEQVYGTNLSSYWVHKLEVSGDIDRDGRKELMFYMGDDTSQESIYLFLKPDGVKQVNLGDTDLPGMTVNKDLDLQVFRGVVVATWDRTAAIWESKTKSHGWVLGDCVAIRAQPNMESKIVSMTSKNEILSVVQTSDSWVEVQFRYDRKGWISAKNFSFTSPVTMIQFTKPWAVSIHIHKLTRENLD